MKNDETLLKEKVAQIVATIEPRDDNKGFCYFEKMMEEIYKNDPELPIIKEKMDNLITLLNNESSKNDEEFKKFESLDFEDEIWYMI